MSARAYRLRLLSSGVISATLLVACATLAGAAPKQQTTPQPPVTPGPSTQEEVADFADRFFPEHMAQQHVPGCVFLLVKDGHILLSRGYGVADVPHQKPVKPDSTVFAIASVSKLFVATAVLQLVDRGQLGLH